MGGNGNQREHGLFLRGFAIFQTSVTRPICVLAYLLFTEGIRATIQTIRAKNINALCNLAEYLETKILDLRLPFNYCIFVLCLYVKVFVCMSV